MSLMHTRVYDSSELRDIANIQRRRVAEVEKRDSDYLFTCNLIWRAAQEVVSEWSEKRFMTLWLELERGLTRLGASCHPPRSR